MSKRVNLVAEMGDNHITVGWLEITPTGRILEAYFMDPVAKVTTGEPYNDTRCAVCSRDECVKDFVTEGGENCLCCKSNHGRVDPNTVQAKAEPKKGYHNLVGIEEENER